MRFGLFILLAVTAARLQAAEVLFIGNSYTYGGNEGPVKTLGGVPKLVELIAASKGKTVFVKMITTGGKDWGYHLKQVATYDALKERPWTWIVLQDYSTKPTHVGNATEFLENGGILYQKAKEAAPQAKILLYATWARGKGSPLYGGASSAKTFAGPEEMLSEITGNYSELQNRLESAEPGRQIELAPVGAAFALSLKKHPEISLYGADNHHASAEGSYLAALVIYASLFQDDPVGAAREFPNFTIAADQASHLQEIARECTEAGKPR